MAGYKGYSMSNNAVAAYKNGEKPWTKWTKNDILNEISNLKLKASINDFKNMPLKLLREECLYYSSWHHTSSYYQKTDFYSINQEYISELTTEKINEKIKLFKEREIEEKLRKEKIETWKCEFLEWSGTRKHPKATKHVEIGKVKGNYFYRENGTKKNINARGFKFLEQII